MSETPCPMLLRGTRAICGLMVESKFAAGAVASGLLTWSDALGLRVVGAEGLKA